MKSFIFMLSFVTSLTGCSQSQFGSSGGGAAQSRTPSPSPAPAPAPAPAPTPATAPTPAPTTNPIQTSLNNLRWELPCGSDGLTLKSPVVTSTSLTADPNTLYNVTLHFRGFVETNSYANPLSSSGYWSDGGTPSNTPINIYSLNISNPAKTYYLNTALSPSTIDTLAYIDYQETVVMRGNAVVTMSANPIDGRELPLPSDLSTVLPPSTTLPSDLKIIQGQFIQMNVVGITAQ